MHVPHAVLVLNTLTHLSTRWNMVVDYQLLAFASRCVVVLDVRHSIPKVFIAY